MTRFAAVDCGTNSLRLLVADLRDGGVHELVRTMEVVRLGEGLHHTGIISDAALARAEATAGRYAQRCADLGVERLRCVATAATRAAQNADRFLDVMVAAFNRWGTHPEVIEGQEEAELSFRGATHGVAQHQTGPFVVVDVGGGSTEVVRGQSDVDDAVSVPLGCVTLGEQLRITDAVDEAQWEHIARLTREALAQAPYAEVGTLVGVAGTATTVACHLLGLASYNSDAIQNAVFSPGQVVDGCRELATMSVSQRRELGFMHPGRADVIGVGAVMWATVIEGVAALNPQVNVVISERDILDGLVLSMAHPGDAVLADTALTLGARST